jgi:hypothetical protein
LDLIKTENSEKLNYYVGTKVVEQTTRGHKLILNQSLDLIQQCKIPLVSIARCKTKRDFEGPFIGASMSRAFSKSVGKSKLKNAKRIAVIGCGTVGEATIKELRRTHPSKVIDAIDIDYETRERVKTSYNCSSYPHLPSNRLYDVVFGCTGYTSFHYDQIHQLADNAVLASGSSAAIEFNRSRFIELAEMDDNDDIEILNQEETINKGIRAEIAIRHNNQTFSFLHAGFPINFDGEIECVPVDIIQSTHALLIMGCVQVLSQNNPGINGLDPSIDKIVYDASLLQLAEQL